MLALPNHDEVKTKLIRETPDQIQERAANLERLAALGNRLIEDGSLKTADFYFNWITWIDPINFKALLGQGKVRAKLDQHKFAVHSFQKARLVSHVSEEIQMWGPIASIFENTSFMPEIIEHGEEIETIAAIIKDFNLDENVPMTWTALGIAFTERDLYSFAILAFDKAISLNRMDYNAWLGLSHAYKQTNKYTKSSYSRRMASRIAMTF